VQVQIWMGWSWKTKRSWKAYSWALVRDFTLMDGIQSPGNKEPIIFTESCHHSSNFVMLVPPPSERLTFNRWQEKYLAAFASMNRDKEVMKFFPGTLSFEETIGFLIRIEKHFEEQGFGLYAIEKKENDRLIGFTGFSKVPFESFFSPGIEIGWRFSKQEWGKGYATEAARTCLAFGFSKLGFEKIYSFTSILNKRSENVMKKIGMSPAGEFEHPMIPIGNPLRTHILYQLSKKD
jgi:ribosomal-protein-alanine N-acetyltransferase